MRSLCVRTLAGDAGAGVSTGVPLAWRLLGRCRLAADAVLQGGPVRAAPSSVSCKHNIDTVLTRYLQQLAMASRRHVRGDLNKLRHECVVSTSLFSFLMLTCVPPLPWLRPCEGLPPAAAAAAAAAISGGSGSLAPESLCSRCISAIA